MSAFVFDAAMNSVSASTWSRLAQLLHAEAACPDDLAAVDEGEAHARHVELLHPVLDELLQRRDPRRVQRVRLLPGELSRE